MKMEIDVAEFAAGLKAGKGIGGKDWCFNTID